MLTSAKFCMERSVLCEEATVSFQLLQDLIKTNYYLEQFIIYFKNHISYN